MPNPRAGKPASKRRKGRKRPIPLDPDERRRLLDAPGRRYPTCRRNRAIMAVMLHAGLRSQEVVNLRPGHVKLGEHRIYVKAGKGDKDRTVPIDPILELHLRDWLTIRTSGPAFFTTYRGAPLDTRYLRRMVHRYGKRARIDRDVHPHLLRHTCATAWHEERGLSSRKIQVLLGHSKLETTEGYLSVVIPDLVHEFRTFR